MSPFSRSIRIYSLTTHLLTTHSAPMDFRVELSEFRGPMDLLLFLVRKHEVEITEIPIAPITEQFLQYLEVLKELDVDGVGDFVEMASTLIEIKSRTVLPHGDEAQEPLEDPRQDLVRRLLEYKRYKDAASMLEERGREWRQRYPRLASDQSGAARNPAEEPIHEAELWDLVSAFGRILRQQASTSPSNILYDDTPIQVYMERIHADLIRQGRMAMSELFKPYTNKSTLVGLFLATLELVRHHGVVLEQNELFDEIWILPGDTSAKPADFSEADNYDPATASSAPAPAGKSAKPRARRNRKS
jgi:segregation and condensation protein A